MGASNFGRVRECTKLWTFGIDVDDGEGDDEFVCQDTIDNVVFELKEKDFFGETIKEWYDDYKIVGYFQVPYYNRVGKYWDSNEYYIVLEFGYYEGGRFDIVPHEDGYFSNIYINNAYNKRLQKLVKECEKVFEKYTTPMVRVGGFSDGTSIYETIK